MEQNNIIHEQERFNLPSVKEQEHTLANNSKLLPPPLSMTETALEYVKSGLSVIPIGSDKQPAINRWKPFQTVPAQTAELLSWWSSRNLSMAIVCGQGSGDLEGIDFDEKYNIDCTSLFKRWKELVDMEMYFIFLPMQWAPTLRRLGVRTSVGHFLLIHVLHKFTQPVFQYMANNNQNLR